MKGSTVSAVALVVAGCSACTSTHTLVTVETTRTIEAIDLRPAALPEDPAKAPFAHRVLLQLADGSERRLRPGSVSRTPIAVVIGGREGPMPIDPYYLEHATLAFDEVRAVAFEVDRRSETRRRDTHRETDWGTTTVWIVAPILTLGLLFALAAAAP